MVRSSDEQQTSFDERTEIAKSVRIFLQSMNDKNITQRILSGILGIPEPELSKVKSDQYKNKIKDKYWEKYKRIQNGLIRIEGNELVIYNEHEKEHVRRISMALLARGVVSSPNPEMRKEQEDAYLSSKKMDSGTELVDQEGRSMKEYDRMFYQDLINTAVTQAMRPLIGKIADLEEKILKMKLVTTNRRSYHFSFDEIPDLG